MGVIRRHRYFPGMSFKCPSCERPLFNRRRKTCEFCGKPIPEAYLLTVSQTAKLDRLKAEEAKQHKEFMDQPNSTPGSLNLGGWTDDFSF